ncbi:hypothetical protein GGF50DRAFT_121279 [Schizophyllum commune]
MSALHDPICLRHVYVVPPVASPTPLDLRPMPSTMSGAVRAGRSHPRAQPYPSRNVDPDGCDRNAPASTIVISNLTDTPVPPRPSASGNAGGAAFVTRTDPEPEVHVSTRQDDVTAAVDETEPRRPPASSTVQPCGSGSDQHPIPTSLKQESNQIRRPPGQAGRPNSGGYNLENKLQWSKALYKQIKDWVNQQVERDLDLMKTVAEQEHDVRRICDEALTTENMEFLNMYEDCWPITEFVRTRLIYRKASEKKKEGAKCAQMILRKTRRQYDDY